MNRKGDGNVISYAEQKILEDIVKNTSRSLQDIYMVLGKVYDDDLALDLNRQAAGYSGMKERAAKCLFDTGLVPPPLGGKKVWKRPSGRQKSVEKHRKSW